MLIRQTHSTYVQEASGLDAITLNPSARDKWVYTKPLTAAVLAELKSMLNLHVSGQHHESGQSRVSREEEMVVKVMAAVETNPFATLTSSLINISTGQCADSAVEDDLKGLKELGLKALQATISGDPKKKRVVKLNTFHTQNQKQNKSQQKAKKTENNDEISTLRRLTQIHASGEEMELSDFIGKHECSDYPPSLFQEDGSMRSGTKSSLLKVLKEETGISPHQNLPEDDESTAVVVDAMGSIRRWSFHKGESYGAIAERYFHQLMSEIPRYTCSIHFCCDRYSSDSLKALERDQRCLKAKATKVYEIQEQYLAPDPLDFFAVSQNKANLLDFICEE